MARLDSRNDNGSDRSKTSTGAVVTLIGVYTALYLAVVGILHFTTSPDAAAAIVPEVDQRARRQRQRCAAEPVRDAGGPPAPELVELEPGGSDNSRECTSEIDTECIYN